MIWVVYVCFASVVQPTVILWGASDPWEPVQHAKEVFSGWSADFVELPGMTADTVRQQLTGQGGTTMTLAP